MREIFFCSLLTASLLNANAQLNIGENAVFYLQQKATVYIEGSLSSNSNIEGEGYIEFGGKQMPRINMNGYYISNLLVNGHAPVVLDSEMGIKSGLRLQSSHLQLNDHDIILSEKALISGSNKAYVLTTGTGKVKKMISANLRDYHIPMGTSQAYMPLELNTKGKNQYGIIEVKANDKASSHKPAQVKDYLKYYWSIKKEGNLKDIVVSGQYQLAHVQGSAARLCAYYWDGFNWHIQSKSKNLNGKITAGISSPIGELYAMHEIVGIVPPTIRLLYNPARSFTTLELNGSQTEMYRLILRDVEGRQLQQGDLRVTSGVNRRNIYLNGLPNGTYFLDVISEHKKETFRFLKIE